jgi:hypothetical protein
MVEKDAQVCATGVIVWELIKLRASVTTAKDFS